jgi:hypothetical protein
MNTSTRNALFWVVCIPVRTSLGVAALLFAEYALWWALYVHAAIASLQLAGLVRAALDKTKTRGGFGGLVWWRELRLVTGLCHAAFVGLAFARVWWAGWMLIIDAASGALGWVFVRPVKLDRLEAKQKETITTTTAVKERTRQEMQMQYRPATFKNYEPLPTEGPVKAFVVDRTSTFGLNPKVPYFVSVLLHTYYDTPEAERKTAEWWMGFSDALLHVSAWTAAVTIDCVLFANEGFHFLTPAYATAYAAVISVCVAGGVVMFLTLVNICNVIEVGKLPASYTSLITGTARASVVFNCMTLVMLSFQLMLTQAITTYTPAFVMNAHVLRMLIAVISLKFYGLACTVNNHRILHGGVPG